MKHHWHVSRLPRMAQDDGGGEDPGDGGDGGDTGGGTPGGGGPARPTLCPTSPFCTKIDFVRLSMDTAISLIFQSAWRF